jgi:DNA-directed RNA polymerase subunit RPC12/RpoP
MNFFCIKCKKNFSDEESKPYLPPEVDHVIICPHCKTYYDVVATIRELKRTRIDSDER